MVKKETIATAIWQSAHLVKAIRPLLDGHHPEVVGATLARLAARFIASRDPDIRAEAKKLFLSVFDDFLLIEGEENARSVRVSIATTSAIGSSRSSNC